MAGNIMNFFIVAFLVLNLQSGVYCHTTSVVPYVIGSVIGCVVLVKVIVIGIICCRRKSRQNTLEVSEEGEARKEKRWEKEDKAPLSGSGPNVFGGGFGFTGGDSGRGFGKDGGDKGLARGYSHEDEQSLGFGHKGGDTGRGYRNSIDYYRSNSIASAGSGGGAAH